MSYENLILEEKDYIATITLNHPPANTWNLAMMQEFGKCLDQVEANDQVRVVIITGGGTMFSAGFDVKDAANAGKTSPLGRETWRRLDRFPKPVIAAVNGFALGGGLELAMSCHFIIMSNGPKTKVGLTELNLGIIPGWGGTQRLPRLVGRSKALDMILFSKMLSAEEALEAGLVNKLSAPETLMQDALAFAGAIAKRPPIAVRCVINAMATGLYEGLDAGLNKEAEGSGIVRETEDRQEGFAAFLEKRPPVFKGK
jgi:enoyl-CoA hydratase/carnithine racemase